MDEERSNISTNGVGSLFDSGTAYVSIPSNIDRDKFIKRCMRTQTLFIRGESGEAFRNVICPKYLLKEIIFPIESNKRGSLVAWVKQPKHNIPIVVAAYELKDGFSDIEEERQFRNIKTSSSGNVVDIDGRADKATLDISVSSAENGKGKIKLRVVNPNQTAELEVYVKGQASIFADKKVKLSTNEEFLVELRDADDVVKSYISYKIGVGLVLIDEFGNEIKTQNGKFTVKVGSSGRQLEVGSSVIHLGTIGGAAEPVLLGNKTEDVLESIKDGLDQIATDLGGLATADAAALTALAGTYGITLTYGTVFASLSTNLATLIGTITTQIALIKSTKTKTD